MPVSPSCPWGELLVELLDRVREVLMVDTAVVLLLDDATGQLVATAARGSRRT